MENTASGDASNQTLLVVKIAANETDRLMRLINDILDMRKVESGKLDLLMDVIDARLIVERAVDGVKGLATEANLTIESRIEEGLELYCDEDRTLQVLTNFLANAIKFSPVGSTITVGCVAVGNRCRFSVTDHGPGLPKAEIHKLFGRFEQLRSTDGKQRPGSGLGLAIAKAIVEQHGGQIGVEQPDEGGSTFWFSLPLAMDEDGEEEAETAVSVTGREALPISVQHQQLSAGRAEVVNPTHEKVVLISKAEGDQVSPVSGSSVKSPVKNSFPGARASSTANAPRASSKSSKGKKSKRSKR